jgi:stage V sporulation protein D (sporulation-specific penicillin-binding protein)
MDRNGRQLAVSETVYNIVLDIKVLNDPMYTKAEQGTPSVKEKVINVLSVLLERGADEIRAIADDPANANRNYYILERGVPIDKWQTIKTAIDEGVDYNKLLGAGITTANAKAFKLVCVYYEMQVLRHYPRGDFASQIIGFLRNQGAAWGLENTYDDQLTGVSGRVFRTYTSDGPITEEKPAEQGKTIVTTLDATIQEYSKQAADDAVNVYFADHAAIVVMDPNTGEIIAMAQSPSFDPDKPSDPSGFTDKALEEQWETLTENERLNAMYDMWANFSITSTFEPGSIFKPIVVAAALEEGVISPEDTFYCAGYKMVLNTRINCWVGATGGSHGEQTLEQVLANSCNVGMMEIVEKLGRDRFFQYRNEFGFAEKTGIDLPNENAASSNLIMYSLDQLNPVELATSSFGQGFNTTAIQSISSFAAVINGGYLLKPFVVKQITDADGSVSETFEPQIIRRVISKETSDWMREALQLVISDSGTGRLAMIDGYNIGGKTGTAQQATSEGYASGGHRLAFVAYLPVEDPQYIALALIDNPQSGEQGSTSAVPMLRDVLQKLIDYKNILPSYAIDGNPDANSNLLPDFSGMPLNDVIESLNDLGVDYECVGNGNTVYRQFPKGGVNYSENTLVYLYLSTVEEEEDEEQPDLGVTTEPSATTDSSVTAEPSVMGE